MGYHKKSIPKGTAGEISKIEEELEELKDAYYQNNKIMTLVELSDICGAIILFLKSKFPDITIGDVLKMSVATNSSFEDGSRK